MRDHFNEKLDKEIRNILFFISLLLTLCEKAYWFVFYKV